MARKPDPDPDASALEESRESGASQAAPPDASPTRWLVVAAWTAAVVASAAGAALAMRALEQQVVRGEMVRTPPRIVLRLPPRPEWMPQTLHDRIAGELDPAGASYFDASLARAVHARARRHPWIARVGRVRKGLTDDPNVAFVEVEADYRRPMAVVDVDGFGVFIDGEGVVLRDGFAREVGGRTAEVLEVPRWYVRFTRASGGGMACYADPSAAPKAYRPHLRRYPYVRIEGLEGEVPEPGRPWKGQDVRDAIRLIERFRGERYWPQIASVDVSNHGWRLTPGDHSQPQLRLIAQHGDGKATVVRFGRFPHPKGDWVLSPRRKLENLRAYVRAHDGRLAGVHDWVDLRKDLLTHSRQ